MEEYKERKKAPKKTNENYYSDKNIFYPDFVKNCTWLCEGRELELGIPRKELLDKLPTSNAENWAHDTKYPVNQYAQVGDIICFSCGKRHYSKDGMGHVGVIEHKYEDWSIDVINSGVNMGFQRVHIKYPYKIWIKSKYKYTFDGCIHIRDYASEWVEANYKTLKQKYVRKTPEVSNNKVKYNKIPASMKINCNKTTGGYARCKKGIVMHLTEFKYDVKGNLWGKWNNLWICVNDKTGNQVKKIK